jgi:cytochrome c-type biogenesis protein CcmH
LIHVAFKPWALVAVILMASAQVGARDALPVAEDPVLEARVVKIASELRCLVCQNQTIADSHAGLAVDLRNQVRDMLREGKSEADIVNYMTARYGDFVLYRPRLKATTLLLWAGPGVMGLGGLFALFIVLRRRSRLPPEAFDPEPVDGGLQPQPKTPHDAP